MGLADAIWMVFAIGAMVGMFAACILAVTIGVRFLENALERRRRQKQAG
jgi:putative Ca2+/H+ antiporter (TMEM165/GDT1 family)